MTQHAVVAVPVQDEADRIGPCLLALANQQDAAFTAIVLVINNTTDHTPHIVEALRPTLPVPVIPLVLTLPPERACAGVARRIGMEHALSLLGSEPGLLFTTDADGVVPATWLADNIRHIAAGADAVAGRAVLFAEDDATIPARLRAADQLERAYATALDEIDARLDPVAWDPWPRHTEHSGASIAVTADAYSRAGGMPPVHLAEDRQFFNALCRTDARIRHAPDVVVAVSGRTLGRAEGGMADTIRRRLVAPDPFLDNALEPARMHALRATLRQDVRRCWSGTRSDRTAVQTDLANALGLTEAMVCQAWTAQWFGDAWMSLERDSPALKRCVVSVRQAAQQLDLARRILAAHPLRNRSRLSMPFLDGYRRQNQTRKAPLS